jgi:hypothetical protein
MGGGAKRPCDRATKRPSPTTHQRCCGVHESLRVDVAVRVGVVLIHGLESRRDRGERLAMGRKVIHAPPCIFP